MLELDESALSALMSGADPAREAGSCSLSTADLATVVRSRRNRRRVRMVAPVLMLAVAGGTAAAMSLQSPTTPTTNARGVGCYQTASLTANTLVTAVANADPVATCRAQWVEGFHQPAPADLSECVNHGLPAVFPGPLDVCDSLGIARLNTASR